MGNDISGTVSTLVRGVSEIVGSVPGAPLEGVARDVSVDAVKKIAASVEHAFDMVFGKGTQASGPTQVAQPLDLSSLREVNRKIDSLVEEARKHLNSANSQHVDKAQQMVRQLVHVQQILGQLWEMQAPEYIARRLY